MCDFDGHVGYVVAVAVVAAWVMVAVRDGR